MNICDGTKQIYPNKQQQQQKKDSKKRYSINFRSSLPEVFCKKDCH